MQLGDYVRIQDSITGTLLLAGKITKATANPIGYSIDGKLFFNPNSLKFKIKVLDFEVRNIYCTACDNRKYIRYNHNNIDNTFEYDFFEWTDIEPEVAETCYLLNKLDFIETYSSCSGHKRIPAYIDFCILDYKKFFDFIKDMNEYGLFSYCTKHGELEEGYKFRLIIGVEGENTCHLELVDINSTFDQINDFLKKYLDL